MWKYLKRETIGGKKMVLSEEFTSGSRIVTDKEDNGEEKITSDTSKEEKVTPLTLLFGDKPQVKILELFLEYPGKSMNKSDIRRNTGTSRNTVINNMKRLKRLNIMNKYGYRYKLKENHDVVVALQDLVSVVNESARLGGEIKGK